jgi:carbamoyl-phosphate synthase small subunit
MGESQNAVLVLADGSIFHGKAFGKIGTTSGELCFNTGMTGYQEVFTDPSYFGQIIIMNNVHTGNYGVMPTDVESDKIQINGLIGRNLEARFSRMMAVASLQHYLETQGIVSIQDVDTRALVIKIRKEGAMNCIISSETTDIEYLKSKLAEVPSMGGLELASVVSTENVYSLGNPEASIRVAVLDFGVKRNIIQCLADRGVYIKVYPAKTSLAEMQLFEPHGFFISNGPGDPSAMDYAVETIKEILKLKKPLFGICLGHQLLALANGISTFKMHHGHRGLNHPVRNLITGLCEITTQNHGFGVDPEAVKKSNNTEITHVNLNDQSIEGIRLTDTPAFSVQYHPEATPGPHDSRYLFDDFVNLIKAQNDI